MDTTTVSAAVAEVWPRSNPLQGMSMKDLTGLLGIAPTEQAGANIVAADGWPILSERALYGPAGDIVRAISPHSEADPAAILLQFLVAFGNVIGPSAHCNVESTRHGLNLFAVLVGESSKARKGTSWGHVRRLFHDIDPVWTENRVTGGLSSAEGLINEVRDLDAPTDRRLLAMSDEFASVLRIMAREGNTLSPILRTAWDSGNLRTLVKNDPLKATGAHISSVGHITRQELVKYLNDTESHNGFANRLLWVCVKRSKCLPEGGSVPSRQMEALASRLKEVIAWASEPERELQRDPQARQLWASAYPKLSDGLPGLLGAATSRAEAQVLRLSAIYACLDQSAVITVQHLWASLALWDYCFDSARFIFGDATGDPVADRIRHELEDAGEDGKTRTEIRDIFRRHVGSEQIERALNLLAALGHAERQTLPAPAGGGRPIEIWAATKATFAT